MAKQQQVQMPGVFGGLMRYDSEYKSKFMMSPKVVIWFIVLIIAFVVLLRIMYPFALDSSGGGIIGGHGGLIIGLLDSAI